MSKSAVIIEEVSLRDGLQFEQRLLSRDEKLALFHQLRAAGLPRIQVGSFVNPSRVPQMADTEALVEAIGRCEDTRVTGLVLNARGLERAFGCGLSHVSLSASVSDSHSRQNAGRPAAEAIASVRDLITVARQAGLTVSAGVQCAFGCVYEGAIPEARVVEALVSMAAAGATEIQLADTTGMAHPDQVERLVRRVQAAVGPVPISLHLHDTRGLGMANLLAGYRSGVRIFDASAGGLGGCPFVPGAAGNVATEDVAHLFEAMGVPTGIDLPRLCTAVNAYEQLLGRRLPGRLSRVLASRPTGVTGQEKR